MTSERAFLATLLHGDDAGALTCERVATLLEIYLAVCEELGVTDPADPLAARIARHLILLAAEDGDEVPALKARTIARVKAS